MPRKLTQAQRALLELLSHGDRLIVSADTSKPYLVMRIRLSAVNALRKAGALTYAYKEPDQLVISEHGQKLLAEPWP